ncbi:MAG TPA: galactose-1-phosphate uridylyltransferase [Clostridia bacterium]|jgi:UDPglucose--hexose-1-phosphate uridylyltransferase|nr:galactose-1-phosphate uridylyltransferase [Clostridia bacterium]
MKKSTPSIGVSIANLVEYAKNTLGLDKYDAVYAHNALLSLFSQQKPEAPSSPVPTLQTGILEPIIHYAIDNKLTTEEDSLAFETKVMGLVTPSPSNVISSFDSIAATEGTKAACKYLNDLGWNSNYLRHVDIRKNLVWKVDLPDGDMIISVNLAKPEKDNKQVAAQRVAPQNKYPKCPICLENLGLSGKRDTLRLIPFFLNDESWFLQFSPYVYFDNHCIAVADDHRPMKVDKNTFIRLLDFVEMFPHYFMGSNSDLPIVGGSILSHEHYQGGSKVLPMFDRKNKTYYYSQNHPAVGISILDWYNSVIKLTSLNRGELEKQAEEILNAWREYSDKSVNVLAKTTEQHNTITVIATYDKTNGYSLYLILRNNRTDKDHPYGIFHPTEDMHNIKKEGIGLIEAMGLFILPGRLDRECKLMAEILTGKTPLSLHDLAKEDHPLFKHLGMVMQLSNDNGLELTEDEANLAIKEYINHKCVEILRCTAVFKNDEQGVQAFDKFMQSLNLKQQ